MQHRPNSSLASRILAVAFVGAALTVACGTAAQGGFPSESSPVGGDGGSGSSSGGSSGGGGAGADSGNQTGSLFGSGDASTATSADAACAAVITKGRQSPLDIYIMLDQSSSMDEMVAGGQTKWQAVTSALDTFVMTPQTGVSVGLQYFGLPPNGTVSSSCTERAPCTSIAQCGGSGNICVPRLGCFCLGNLGDSCTGADYAVPDVEIAPLPGVGAAISASITRHSPNTATPTSAALQGAVQHASDWAKAHPGHVAIALLATDGDPTECDASIANIEAIASTAAGATPAILTFVIGVGSSTTNLNGIAAAGGTGQAFIVDTTMNVNQQFIAALGKIRDAVLACTYAIPVPTSGTPDFKSVNVQYTSSGGVAVVIPNVSDKSRCPVSGNAWYYDNSAAPTHIILCDATCKSIAADKSGEIDVLLGCATKVF